MRTDDLRSAPEFRCDEHAPEAVYVYHDAAGNKVGAVARFAPGTLKPEKKTFKQYRYEAGQWRLGLNGLELPLWNLPRVLKAVVDREPIYVVEGERCAELLSEIGGVATTNSGGAGKWKAAYTHSLAGADVVLIHDNDDPGRNHMKSVATALHGVAASSVRIDPPGIDEHRDVDGYDVGDWIQAGGTLDALKSVVETSSFHAQVGEDAEHWPEPIHFKTNEDPEPFPIEDGLPPFLGELAAEIAALVRADVTAPAVIIPCVLSAAVGNAYSIRASKSHAEPNLARYTLWSKPSGDRGSALFRIVTEPLTTWTDVAYREYAIRRDEIMASRIVLTKRAEYLERDAARAKDHSARVKLSEEALEVRLQIQKVPPQPMLFIGDTTSEALVKSMAERGGALAVFSADARKTVDQVLGRYRGDGKTDDSIYLLAHGGDYTDRNRIGQTSDGELTRIQHPSLAVALVVQPDKLAELAGNSSLMSSGFLPRCNVVQPLSFVGTRLETGEEQPLNVGIRRRWDSIVRAVVDERMAIVARVQAETASTVELTLCPDAMERRREFANEIELQLAPNGNLRGAAAFGSKCAGEAVRLAGLFHLAELAERHELPQAGRIPVSIETWMYAEVQQRWQIRETLRVLSLAQEDTLTKLARRVLNWVAAKPRDRAELSARDLISAHITESKEHAVETFRWLAQRGWVIEKPPTGREKEPRWRLHPLVLGGGES